MLGGMTNTPNPTLTTTAGDLRESKEGRRAVAMRLVQKHRMAAGAAKAFAKRGNVEGATAWKAKRNGFRWYWLAWFAVAVLGFAVPELVVIADGRMELTLSDTVDALAKRYHLLGWGVAALLALLAALMPVLALHFHLL